MERFAFKIDAALKANLYKICRLCGIDNPSKVPIITNESDVIDLDEPSLGQKVYELVGFMVTKNDKMPQTICSLCVDKINDFYEFREMCYATNKQTRNLLGLKQADPEKFLDIKPIIKTEAVSVVTPGAKRGRKRKTDDNTTAGVSGNSANVKSKAPDIALEVVKSEPIGWRKKQRLQQQLTASKSEIKKEPMETDVVINKTALLEKRRCKASCSVCGERFLNKEVAEEHKSVVHVPSVVRYYCYACNQNHNRMSDIKAHQLWHKLSKTPYQCPLCDATVANNYAFTRHMREHTPPTPLGLLVLDRECPLCKKTFLTNFFYNTHPCARRTRKCGGCNRTLNSEIGYMRHAPNCAKIYLNYSKHILPEVAESETHIRIKNEHGTEEETLHSTVVSQEKDMQPVVVLERLASPLLRAITTPNTITRASDRVSSKNYLKRVDQLLKNTISTLVSIKHEPEVHINDTEPPLTAEQPESEPEEDTAGYDDCYGNAAHDDSDEDDKVNTAPDLTTVAVKQEQIDEAYEAQQIPGNEKVQVKQEPLKLKLKITKNHGQLNSSLVDEDNDLQLQSKSGKKKKKRKHRERNKELQAENNAKGSEDTEVTEAAATIEAPNTTMVSIKQERVDDSYDAAFESQSQCEPQVTVMTSIPMPQISSSYNEEHQEPAIREQEPEDVKPNRLELDRLMQITHIAGGVALAEEAIPPENAMEAVPNESLVQMPVNQTKIKKSTARKSTGGTTRQPATSSSTASAAVLPQIVAVESTATLPFKLLPIKSEPVNRGYADEYEKQVETDARVQPGAAADEAVAEQQQTADAANEINHNEKINEESAYIRTLDLNKLNIKQEKDLHISDVDINDSGADNVHYNGSHESENSEEDEDEDSASSADEAEEDMDTFDQEEERIYREIELPLLEEHSSVREPALDTQIDTEMLPITVQSGLVEPPITSLDTAPVQDSLLTQPGLESQSDADMIAAPNPTSCAIEPAVDQPQSELELPVAEAQDAVESTTAVLDTEHREVATENDSEMQQLDKEEPQQNSASESDFNFVITSVCSQAEKEHENDISVPQTPEKSVNSCEENINSPILMLSSPKDNEILAQPCFNSPSSSSNYHCAEEQQNVLNHELSATVEQEQIINEDQPTELLAEPEVQNEAGPSTSESCQDLENAENPSGNEETENLINEQQQQQMQQNQQQQEQQQQRCQINDDSNINEIAENNNNANIERELQDDANVAQENNSNVE